MGIEPTLLGESELFDFGMFHYWANQLMCNRRYRARQGQPMSRSRGASIHGRLAGARVM
jgi:hypothetical protein